MKSQTSLLVYVVASLYLSVSLSLGKPLQCEWSDVECVVAVGDIHGAYESFVALLDNAGLVDEKLHWIAGKTHLVQMGDVVDRGGESRKCLDLLMQLEKEAKWSGGHVHVLIGDHEAMNIVGILDYTSKEELESYDSPETRKIWEAAFHEVLDTKRSEAEEAGATSPSDEDIRKQFEDEYPRGYFGHRAAFRPEGQYGAWILSHNVAVRINNTVFSHGDWSEEISALGIEEVNRKVRAELSGEAPIEDGISFHAKGPLQYRGLAKVPLTRRLQEAQRARVDRILANLGAARMVVGHTVTEGVIEARFGGKHISIDVGMLDLYRGGHQVALYIEGDSLWAIHPLGIVKLPEILDQSTITDYYVEVAAVDPENVNLHEMLGDEYVKSGDMAAARNTFEHLLTIDETPLPRYRLALGDAYRDLGEKEMARKQYLAYITELESLIEAHPDNPNLKNLLARFCVNHSLRLELAERTIRSAVSAEPGNSALLLTLGRVQLALHQHSDAAQTLERVVKLGSAGYDSLYYLGLSYVGLGDSQKAREAFELAIKEDPERPEAREELRKLEVGNISLLPLDRLEDDRFSSEMPDQVL